MSRITPRHTAAQYSAHQIAAKKFVECLNAYNDIMAKIQTAKQMVIDSGKWKTFDDCVEEIGEYVTDARQDYLIEDFDAFVVACEAEYPKHGVRVAIPGMIPEYAELENLKQSKIELINVVCSVIKTKAQSIFHASIIDQNEFLTLACKAVGINMEIKL